MDYLTQTVNYTPLNLKKKNNLTIFFLLILFFISGLTASLLVKKENKAKITEIKIQAEPVVLPASTKITITDTPSHDTRFDNAIDDNKNIIIDINKQ